MYISRERNSEVNIVTEPSLALKFLYNTLIGRMILKVLITKPISNLAALFMNSGL